MQAVRSMLEEQQRETENCVFRQCATLQDVLAQAERRMTLLAQSFRRMWDRMERSEPERPP